MTKTITQNNALYRAQLNRRSSEIHRERRRLEHKIFWLKLLAFLRRELSELFSPTHAARAAHIFPPSGGQKKGTNVPR